MRYSRTSLFLGVTMLVFVGLFTLPACTKSLQLGPSAGPVHLSAQSVSFDTVFTSAISTYRTITLYNDQANAVLIPSLSLKGDRAGRSMYLFSAGGNAGPLITNLRINGKDSLILYIKVLVAADQHTAPFLVQDSLLINTGNPVTAIPLITYAQNVQRISDTLLSVNTHWNAAIPYLIGQSLTIGKGSILSIDPGTRIYFHGSTGLTVNGSLQVNGTQQAPVYFIPDRREALYSTIPGQWKGILIHAGSSGNKLCYAIIKNAETGIVMSSATPGTSSQTRIVNSRIFNMTYDGIYCKNSGLDLLNSLVYNCGNSLLDFQGDASLRILQSTFYNSGDFSFHTLPGVSIAFAAAKDSLICLNNIVSGSLPEEMSLSGGKVITFAGNLIQSVRLSALYPLNSFNKDALFKNRVTDDFHLQSAGSAAYQTGINTGVADSLILRIDLDEKLRRRPPSAGCYEFY